MDHYVVTAVSEERSVSCVETMDRFTHVCQFLPDDSDVNKYYNFSAYAVTRGIDGILYKWKNHFYEMKGDVGMSLHEKERNKKMPTPRHKVTHNPIPTSLFCFNMLFVCLL